MSKVLVYPPIEIWLRGEQVPRWQLELGRHLRNAWPEAVRIRVIPGPPPRHRPWLARRMRALEPESVGDSGLAVAGDDSEASSRLVIDLRGRIDPDDEHVRHTSSARLVFCTLGGDLAAQELPFAAELMAGAKTTTIAIEFDVRDAQQEQGRVELGCWRTLPEQYPGFAERVLGDLPGACLRVLLSAMPKSDEAVYAAGASFGCAGAPPVRPPVWPVSIVVLFFMARALAARLWRDLFRHEQWTIGIAEAPIQAFLGKQANAPVRWLPAGSRTEYLADPFGVGHGADCRIYAERFSYRRRKGWIVALLPGQSASPVAERHSLELDTHLSYPYIFRDKGRLWGVPENFESNSIRLYELAEGLSPEWRGGRKLVDGFAGIDATVLEWGGQWWMFATDRDTGPDSHLHAWHAASVEGPWHAHELNPIKIDVRSARPGGTPFVHEGRLFRPAQDCSQTYGGRVVINEVIRLDSRVFDEVPAAYVEPDRAGIWRDGLHTLSACGDNLTLLDAKRTVFSSWAFWGTVRSISGKLSALVRRHLTTAAKRP